MGGFGLSVFKSFCMYIKPWLLAWASSIRLGFVFWVDSTKATAGFDGGMVFWRLLPKDDIVLQHQADQEVAQ